MAAAPMNVLFLCTGNSARSILAEGLLAGLGHDRFRAFSAGSHPAGVVHPLALDLLGKNGFGLREFRSKSWDEFAQPDAPVMDFVFTVCDDAAGETCPVWPGQPITAHWGVEDPSGTIGDEVTRRRAFLKAFTVLRSRIQLFLALPLDTLDRLALTRGLSEIGRS